MGNMWASAPYSPGPALVQRDVRYIWRFVCCVLYLYKFNRLWKCKFASCKSSVIFLNHVILTQHFFARRSRNEICGFSWPCYSVMLCSEDSGTHTQSLWWLALVHVSCMPTPFSSNTNTELSKSKVLLKQSGQLDYKKRPSTRPLSTFFQVFSSGYVLSNLYISSVWKMSLRMSFISRHWFRQKYNLWGQLVLGWRRKGQEWT